MNSDNLLVLMNIIICKEQVLRNVEFANKIKMLKKIHYMEEQPQLSL